MTEEIKEEKLLLHCYVLVPHDELIKMANNYELYEMTYATEERRDKALESFIRTLLKYSDHRKATLYNKYFPISDISDTYDPDERNEKHRQMDHEMHTSYDDCYLSDGTLNKVYNENVSHMCTSDRFYWFTYSKYTN